MSLLKYFLLIIIFTVLFSCKENGLTNTNNHASINIKVINKDGKPAANTLIYIYLNYYKDTTITNSIGEFDTTLIEGKYTIEIQIPEGLVCFSDLTPIATYIGGETYDILYKPYNNKGDVKIAVIDSNNKPINNINVAIITKYFYDDNNTLKFSGMKPYIYLSYITDSNGQVSFKELPFYFGFYILVFINENNWKLCGRFGLDLQEPTVNTTVMF